MRGEVALVHEQGQDIAVLAVKSQVVSEPGRREQMLAFGEREFGVRTVLLAENGRSWGPPDMVRWLEGVSPAQLPWCEFSLK
jgi:hypothetical protein